MISTRYQGGSPNARQPPTTGFNTPLHGYGSPQPKPWFNAKKPWNDEASTTTLATTTTYGWAINQGSDGTVWKEMVNGKAGNQKDPGGIKEGSGGNPSGNPILEGSEWFHESSERSDEGLKPNPSTRLWMQGWTA
jgi:hypothetical protein